MTKVNLDGKLVLNLPPNVNYRLKQDGSVTYINIEVLKGDSKKAKTNIKTTTSMPILFRVEPEKLKLVNKLYAEGKTAMTISKDLGILYVSVIRALKAQGIYVGRKVNPNGTPSMPIVFRHDPDKLELACKLYYDGNSALAISKELNVQYVSLIRALKAQGIYKERKHLLTKNEKRATYVPLTAEQKEKIACVYEAGGSTTELAKVYSTTRLRVKGALMDMGVELRDERKDGKPRAERLSDAEKRAIDNAWQDNKPFNEIVELISAKPDQIKRYMKMMHYPIS